MRALACMLMRKHRAMCQAMHACGQVQKACRSTPTPPGAERFVRRKLLAWQCSLVAVLYGMQYAYGRLQSAMGRPGIEQGWPSIAQPAHALPTSNLAEVYALGR